MWDRSAAGRIGSVETTRLIAASAVFGTVHLRELGDLAVDTSPPVVPPWVWYRVLALVPEGRKTVSQDVSPGLAVRDYMLSPGGAIENRN